MRFLYSAFFLFLSLTFSLQATTHTVTTPGLNFSPASLTISLGDTINFAIGTSHNVVEVDLTTWSSNGNTPLPGGFSLPFGGGLLILQSVGSYYYVCSPHASLGMKGMITVENTSITTGSVVSSFCKGGTLAVPFTITGTFNAGNVFTAQLSNSSGSFANPTPIGTLTGTAAGQISATIPAATPTGGGFRIRVVSSQPAITGSDNGSDLTTLEIPSAAITPAGPTSFCEGQSVQLDATTGAGLTYQWRLNGISIPGATAASYTASMAGQYSVEVSNGSCAATSANTRVIVYPANPTTLVWTGNVDSDWGTLGNWDSPCAVPDAGDTVIIGSSIAPPALVPPIALGKLALDHGTGLTLGGTLQINGNLTLTSGSIILGGADLILSATASLTGGSAANFVITDGSGRLRIDGIGVGGKTGAVLFPVGTQASSYTPVLLMNAGLADQFGIGVSDGVLDGGSSGTALVTNVVDKTWHIDEAVPGGSNATLTFGWSTAEELPAFDRALCYIAHHDGSDWQPLQSVGAAVGGAPWQRSVSGVTAFSPFAIGDGGSPLPVEYRTLTADVKNETVIIRWETEQEINSRGFAVERGTSERGPWQELYFQESAGGARKAASYEYHDHPPAAGSWFYRLRQVDMDGSRAFSPVLHADLAAPERSLAIASVWPNPLRLSTGTDMAITFSAHESGHAVLSLHNLLGKRVADVYDGEVRAGSSTTVRFSAADLPPGVYLCRLSLGGRSIHRRAVIMR